jgi:hypothetical protein
MSTERGSACSKYRFRVPNTDSVFQIPIHSTRIAHRAANSVAFSDSVGIETILLNLAHLVDQKLLIT